MKGLPALNEDLVERVDALGTTPITMTGYRHTAVGRDPLSGVGARLSGGRWNPRGVPTIYLARPEAAAVAELQHLAEMGGTKYEALVQAGRELHTVQVVQLEVLDLRQDDARLALGLTMEDLRDDDWSACNAVGQAAWFLQFPAVIAPSARHDDGHVIVIFEDRILSEVECTHSRRLT